MSKVNLIGISGRLASGKDTVAAIIRDLTRPEIEGYITFVNGEWKPALGGSDWRIRKYAYKLKQIASILTGIPIEKFEDQEFKKSYLGPEWDKWTVGYNDKYGSEKKHFGSGKEANEFIDKLGEEGGYFIYGNDHERLTVRSFLQKLGTESVRNGLHHNTWINALFADFTEDSKWIITDVRYPNEYEAIKQRGGVMIRVNRGEQSKDAHISETALDDFKFDYTINNNGSLDELKENVSEVLKAIL